MRDPGLVAAPSADAATVRVTFEYVAWATVWLLVGTTIDDDEAAGTGVRSPLGRRRLQPLARQVFG